MKNKKLLISLLALNTISGAYVNAAPIERLGNKIIKNLEQGKSTNESYKLIEKILNKKNKELKDLYKQADYVVKPEYLEWQIFFSGFYGDSKRGDNTSDNAQFSSNSTKINGKTFSQEQKAKTIDLGIVIPMKGLAKEPIGLNVTPKQINTPEVNIPILDIEIPEVTKEFDVASFQPIQSIQAPYLGALSKLWPRTSTLGEIATVNESNSYFENTVDAVIDGSTGSKSVFYLGTGKIVNDAKITMNYTGTGTPQFQGVWANNQNNKYIDFENNGTIIIDTKISGDIGSVMGIHYYTHTTNPEELTPEMFTKDPKKVILSDGTVSQGAYIRNFGHVEDYGAVWAQFEDTEGDYISHLPGKPVGSIIVDASKTDENKAGQAFQLWRCCYNKVPDKLERIDPGILVVRRGSTGINVVEQNIGMRTEILNLNNDSRYPGFSDTPNDKSKDSQIIVEGGFKSTGEAMGGNAVILTSSGSNNLVNGLAQVVNTPIYLTDQKTNGIVILNNSYLGQISINGDVNIMVPVTGSYTADPLYGSTNANYTVGGVTKADNQIIGIYASNSSLPITNTANISNMISDTHSVTLADGTNLSYTGNENGVNRTIGVYANFSGALTPNGTVPNPGYLYTQDGGSVKMGGRDSVGVYNKISDVLIKNSDIEAHNGAIAVLTEANGVNGKTVIQDSRLTAGKGSLLFYNTNGGKVDFQGNNQALIKTGGTALYGKGSASLADFSNLNNLTLKMEEGSTILLLDTPVSAITLSGLPTISGINIDPASSSKYSNFKQYKGQFIIDQNSVLDNDNDEYGKIVLVATKTTLNLGNTITGSKEGLVAIKTAANNETNTLNTGAINNGEITLIGDKSVGLYTDFGTNSNAATGKIKVTGNNGIGIFAENSSITSNLGDIRIGNNGVGIYAVSNQDTNNIQSYGTGTINVTNSGDIKAESGSRAVGIYIDNNKAGSNYNNSYLNLGGTIDVSNSTNGIGVYVQKTTITGSGDITVGQNGVGIYANDSKINLTGLNMNLHGDNALGFYLDGTTEFNASGNIDVTGRNVTLFNVLSSGTFNNNLTVTSTSASSYVIGNINNGKFLYSGTVDLASNGTLINGRNSSVLLDGITVLNSTGTNVIGVALDGQGIPELSWGTAADGTNRGTMNLGNNSVGMFGVNGVRFSNEAGSSISLGDDSVGIYTSGSLSYAVNDGAVSLGSNSQGMFIKDSTDKLENSINGTINSTGTNVIGMYSESTGTTTINNFGTIGLLGDNSVGIYTSGSGETITNTGVIGIGNSQKADNPSIGIFTNNSIIHNTGTLNIGKNSVGIYNGTGTTNQRGTINVGDNGVGIYTSGGLIDLDFSSELNLNSGTTVGVYADNGSTVINNALITAGSENYVFVINNHSNLINNSIVTLGDDSVFIYSNGAGTITNTNTGNITMNGSNNVGIYSVKGGDIINAGNITGSIGESNTGIYNSDGSITNTGNIKVGDSVVEKSINGNINADESKFAVGIYGENSIINNSGNIEVGAGGVGFYTKDNKVTAINTGDIVSYGDEAIGILANNGKVNNSGNITLNGNNSIGIAVNNNAEIVNTGIITLNGDKSIGIYGNVGAKITNLSTIIINGNNSIGINLLGTSILENEGTITISSGSINSKGVLIGSGEYEIPGIVNAGVINVSENFDLRGFDISIKVNPDTITKPTNPEDAGADFVSDAVKFYAPSFTVGDETIGILPDFTQGTNALTYKLKNVFVNGKSVNGGKISVLSKSLTWEATPETNAEGNVDIWMKKIPYDNFTNGLWYQDFGVALDQKYEGATGKAGEIFDKIDYIEKESDFRRIMEALSGSLYSNINQREETIADIFEDSLGILEISDNNNKENIKLNIIAAKGKLSDDTDGVTGYDYTATGIQALKEIERTYKHKFGYSLGYLHTGFDFKDENSSEEKVDTIQLGIHNQYKLSNWTLYNTLTGRVSFHDIERSIEWTNSGKSEITGRYESYSVTSDNKLGKEFELGKKLSITPYGGIKAMYAIRPTFSEKGLEALEVKGNDAWSVKPRAGVEFKTSVPLGAKKAWQLKGTLDFAYEYELSDLNKKEKVKLRAIEDNYHNLAKPGDEKGTFKTKASLGVDLSDRYGIFLTGEYKTGNNDRDDYRAGVTLKAAF